MIDSIMAYQVLFAFVLCLVVLNNLTNFGYEKLWVGIIFITLIAFGGFRGGFTTDYPHYVRAYEYFKHASITEFFTLSNEVYYLEKGYAFFYYLLGKIFDSPIPMFVLSMIAIIVPIWKKCKETISPMLFIILYLCVGNYFASFNIMRQVIVASLFLFAIKYIKSGDFKNYLFFCIALSFIHVSCLLLIPFYFLLRMRPNIKTILINFMIVGVFLLFWDKAVYLVDFYLFNLKFTREHDLKATTNYMTIVVPLVLGIYTLYLSWIQSKGFKQTDIHQKDNALSLKEVPTEYIEWYFCLYWVLTFVLSLKLTYFSRFSTFFVVPALTLTVNSTFKINKDNNIKIITIAIYICCFIYYMFFGQYYSTYYFFWQKGI